MHRFPGRAAAIVVLLVMSACAAEEGSGMGGAAGGQGGSAGSVGSGGDDGAAGGGGAVSGEKLLGELIECDEVAKELGPDGELLDFYDVAYVSVDDPVSAQVTRCGANYGYDGELEPWGAYDCAVMQEVTIMSDLRVRVPCAWHEEEPDGSVETWRWDRVYLRTSPKPSTFSPDAPFGQEVECESVIEEERLVTRSGETYTEIERREVAHVRAIDPASVIITRCGEYWTSNDELSRRKDGCEATTSVTVAADLSVYIECSSTTSRRHGSGSRGHGFERIYVRDDAAEPPASPFGTLVDCDEEVDSIYDAGTTTESRQVDYRAYLTTRDPVSATITRCGQYWSEPHYTTYSADCVSTKAKFFTSDFEVSLRCGSERTGWRPRSEGYQRTWLRID